MVIFDRAPSLTHSRPGREVRDWTILVHWGLPLMRERLLSPDVAARLDAALCDPTLDYGSAADKIETFPCYDGASGKLLFASPTPGARRFSRQRLRSVLLDGLDNVRWGKCLTNIEAPAAGDELGGKATLRFEDGSSFTADFVLGADGTASRVCEILLGEEVGRPSRTGLMFATGYCNYGDPTKVAAVTGVHPVAAIMLGPGICAAVGSQFDPFICSLLCRAHDGYPDIKISHQQHCTHLLRPRHSRLFSG